MSEEIQLAFQLLAVGMITVFLILVLVVQSAKILILVVNKFSGSRLVDDSGLTEIAEPTEDPRAIAAITGAVAHLTGGKGKIKSIKKSSDG